jgi:large subunit ribosomal protein L21
MYAIIEIAGQQFKIEKEMKLFVHRLKAEEGSQVTFDRVMLVDNDGTVQVGIPTVAGATVTATVLSHLKGDKVLVFKKKKRKSYQKMNGHRQYLTSIKIDDIII